jgi:hypothetical protein
MPSQLKVEDTTCTLCNKVYSDNVKFIEPIYNIGYYVCRNDLRQAQLNLEFKANKDFGIPPRPGP